MVLTIQASSRAEDTWVSWLEHGGVRQPDQRFEASDGYGELDRCDQRCQPGKQDEVTLFAGESKWLTATVDTTRIDRNKCRPPGAVPDSV